MHEHLAPLHVPQELQTEALSRARARDESRHVGHGEHVVVNGHDTQVRNERCEGIVGDLRLGGRQDGDERRLAGVGKADQGDIGDGLELQDDIGQLAGLPQQREPGRLAPRAGERGVAEAAETARGDDETRAGADEVGDDLLAVERLHHGAVGHREDDVRAVGTVAVVALALLAVPGFAMRGEVVFQERRDLGIDDQDDTPAAAT